MKRTWPGVALVAVVAALGTPVAQANKGPSSPLVFTHGVASGDVTPYRAILWTRVNRRASVRVEVSTSATFAHCVFARTARARAANDFTIKVDARRLRPDTSYFFRFRQTRDDDGGCRRGDDHDDDDGLVTSPVGTFKTAPNPNTPVDVRFGYSGDSDGTKFAGALFFNNFEVLDQIRLENGDFWVYLGDTIYADSRLRSSPATTLDEYRAAYKQNREYPALQELMRTTSTYAQPDDHEVLNDYDGQTVDPARYAAGRQAFLEYMPVREANLLHDPTCAADPLFRTFDWGSNVDIIILDERSCRSADVAVNPCQEDLAPTLPSSIRPAFGLPPNPPPGCLEAIFDPRRTMLGPVQKQAFKDALLESTAKFKIVVSELAIQQFWALPYDRWEGYGAERNEILNFIRSNNVENLLFLTTDNHANIVNEVFIDRFTDPGPIANEIITGPVATFTLQQAILFGFGPAGLVGFNNLLTLAGVDCRDLDTYSYGVTDVSAGLETAIVSLKDDHGAPIVNQGPSGPPGPCVSAFGP